MFSHNSIWKLLFPLMFFSVKFHFKEGCLRLLFFQYEAWWFLSSRQLQFRPIFIYCVCRMQQWYNLTRTGFLLGIHKKSMTLISLSASESTYTSHFPPPKPVWQKQHTSSFPTSSFCSQHLLICLRPSSTHLLHMLCFPKGLKVGDDITWHFYYPKLKWERVWCQHSLVVLTFDFEQSIRLSALNSHGCVPQGCSDKAGRAVSVCRGSFCYSEL